MAATFTQSLCANSRRWLYELKYKKLHGTWGLFGKFSLLSKYTPRSLLIIGLNFCHLGGYYQRVCFTNFLFTHRLVVKAALVFIGVSVNCAEESPTSAGESC